MTRPAPGGVSLTLAAQKLRISPKTLKARLKDKGIVVHQDPADRRSSLILVADLAKLQDTGKKSSRVLDALKIMRHRLRKLREEVSAATMMLKTHDGRLDQLDEQVRVALKRLDRIEEALSHAGITISLATPVPGTVATVQPGQGVPTQQNTRQNTRQNPHQPAIATAGADIPESDETDADLDHEAVEVAPGRR